MRTGGKLQGLLSRRSNKVASAEWIEAEDDEDAIRIVSERHDGYKCEVWDRKRLVARLDLRREA